MKITSKNLTTSIAIGSLVGLCLSVVPAAHASDYSYHNNNRVVVYFTRHAEKKTELMEIGDGKFMEICGDSKCSEILNAEGELRARLLVDWFDRRGVVDDLTHAFSSHKQRTLQTIVQIAKAAGLNNDIDLMPDGVQQLPANGTELDPESTSPSEEPTITALQMLPGGSVAIVAGHSGTIYDILDGLGINTSDPDDFPRDDEMKVKDFGDIWKIVIRNGVAKFRFRVNLQPTRLRVTD